jgi:hypothetical protein
VDDVRRLVQQDALGHRGRKGDPLYDVCRLPLVGANGFAREGAHESPPGWLPATASTKWVLPGRQRSCFGPCMPPNGLNPVNPEYRS